MPIHKTKINISCHLIKQNVSIFKRKKYLKYTFLRVFQHIFVKKYTVIQKGPYEMFAKFCITQYL